VITEHAAVAAAASLLRRTDARVQPVSAERLSGGKNNRVFKVNLEDGGAVILKSYFHDARDTRDRLGAEWAFLVHAWVRGVRCIPQPLAVDHSDHLGLYSFAPGRKLTADEITAAHVDAALAFVLSVNAAPRDTQTLKPGSEACFSLADHLETVDRRLARLDVLDPDAPHRAEATQFITGALRPTWAVVRARIVADAVALGIKVDDHLSSAEQCLSPSDFGFHNALSGDVLTFIDFEYAGRDDPAKLASDFFCCPEVPTPTHHYGRFVDGLVAGLGLDALHAARARLLLDAYRVKWACIILNHFLPLGAARRSFAAGDAVAQQNAAQLMRAQAKLGELG
jgi:hypothetical protein